MYLNVLIFFHQKASLIRRLCEPRKRFAFRSVQNIELVKLQTRFPRAKYCQVQSRCT